MQITHDAGDDPATAASDGLVPTTHENLAGTHQPGIDGRGEPGSDSSYGIHVSRLDPSQLDTAGHEGPGTGASCGMHSFHHGNMHSAHDAGDNPVTANSDGWVLTAHESLFDPEQPGTSLLKDQQRFSVPHRIATRLNVSRDFPRQIESIDLNTWLSLSDRDFEQLITTSATRSPNRTLDNDHPATTHPTNADPCYETLPTRSGSKSSTWTPTMRPLTNQALQRISDTTRHNATQPRAIDAHHTNTAHDLTAIWRTETLSTMAARIKAIQRESATTHELWRKWCDSYGGGIRDPALHSREFLHNFLTT